MNFQIESFNDSFPDACSLFKQHFEEVSLSTMKGKRPLSINIKKYVDLEALNRLAIFTIREEGQLLAYAAFITDTATHYSKTLYASNDALFVHPSLRQGTTAIKFMKWCEKKLVELSNGNIKIVQWRTKSEHNFSPILKRMGYSEDDITYTKWVGE